MAIKSPPMPRWPHYHTQAIRTRCAACKYLSETAPKQHWLYVLLSTEIWLGNCVVDCKAPRPERYTSSDVVSLGWQAICENSAASGLLQLAASRLAAEIRVSLKGIYLSPRFASKRWSARVNGGGGLERRSSKRSVSLFIQHFQSRRLPLLRVSER